MNSLMPLRRYLSLQFVFIAALPVVIIALLVWQFLIPQMRTITGVQHEGLARAVAGQISGHLMGGQRQLETLVDFVAAEKPYPAVELTTLLDAQCGNGELFETIYVAANGDDIISSVGLARPRRSKRADLLGIDLSGRSFLNRARGLGKTIWSETFLSTASSRLAVALTIPLDASVIVGEITLDKLSEFISHLPVEAGLVTMVLDGQGRIVADSQRLRWGQQLSLNALPESASEGGATYASSSFELEGRPFLGTVVDVQQLGWKVLVAQPIRNAFKPLRSAFVLIGLGLGIALLFAFSVAWFQAGKLSRLFRSYSEKAQAIAQGKYDLSWPPSKTAEFKHLGQNLQQMASMISQREKALVASETRMRITMDSIGDAVIATDAGGEVSMMNPMAEKLTGWPSADAIGRQLSDVFRIVNTHTRQTVASPVEKVLATGKIIGLANHTMLIARDGREYQIADSGAPIRQLDGPILGVVLVFRDVTDAYQQAEKLRKSEKLLKDITANVPGVVYQFTTTGNQVYSTTFVSEKADELFGLQPDTHTFLDHFRKHIPDDETDRFIASLDAAVDQVIPWNYEGRYVKPDGEVIWFSGNAIPHKDGDTITFYGVLMDITERRRLEEALRITQFSFDTAAVGIYRIGSDAQIINVNDHAAKCLGYAIDELTGMSIFDIDPYVNRDNWGAIWQSLLDKGVDIFETTHRRKDGSEMYVEINSNLLEYDGQQFSIAFAQDITERKKAVEDLRQLRNYLSNIINSMPSVLVGVDCECRVTQWNKQAEQVTGMPFNQVCSQPLTAVFPNLVDEMNHIRTAIRDRRVFRDLKIPRQRQDEMRYEDVTVFPLVANGVEGAVIRVDDVTERVRLEEMMIQSEKMLSVGGLAAGMAHEINNPLAGIMQNTAVLENRLLGSIPANHEAAEAAGTTMAAIQHYLKLRKLPVMLENIRTSGKLAAAIVKNMLSFARKSDHVISSHDLGELLDQTIELLHTDYDMKKHYDFKQIQIVREYDQGTTLVPCEASKLQQVFMNILKNGSEAMVEALDAQRQPTFILRISDDGPWVRVEIEDNGPGIDEKTRRRIFEPFFTTKPVGKGTGLGLSVSYFIVTEDHGGEMAAYAAESGGTRFMIRLPKGGKDRP